MAAHAHRAQTALAAKDYTTAIELYTTALQETESPLWLIARATAYQRTGQHQLALQDGDRAVLAAKKRANRDLLAKAQFRRAVALHGLKRYGDARKCLYWVHKLNEKEAALTIWQAKVKTDYEAAGGDDAECNKVTVKEIPDAIEKEKVKDTNGSSTLSKIVDNAKEVVAKVAPATSTPAPTPVGKIRTEWFQSADSITIEIFAKGVNKETLEVNFHETSLEISFPVATGGTYDYTLDPLFHPVDHANSSYRLTPHKLEVTLKKKTSNLKWSALEGEIKPESTPAAVAPTEASKPVETPTTKSEIAPAYPTSSKTGAKNWDKLADENDEKEEGDVDSFFKQLYAGADPDTRRAMMKSFQESNGTSLSTNWSDVGSKTFKTDPPEGMEAKSWEK